MRQNVTKCDTASSHSLMLLHCWMMQDRRWYVERTSWPSHAVRWEAHHLDIAFIRGSLAAHGPRQRWPH